MVETGVEGPLYGKEWYLRYGARGPADKHRPHEPHASGGRTNKHESTLYVEGGERSALCHDKENIRLSNGTPVLR